jgi:PKD repeat protein
VLEIKLGDRPEHASRGRHEDVKMNRLGGRGARLGVGAVLAVLLCALAAASDASASSAGTSQRTAYAKISRVCPAPQPGDASCLALARVPVPSTDAGQPGVSAYTAATAAAEPALAAGRTPKNLASAYGYSPAAGGSGQTIALVDAYDDPKIESDLAIFDENYGISACTKANGCFTKVSQSGSATALPSPDTTGWSVEIALDVEMAHSVCPSCKILLVEAESESFEDLVAGVDEAVKLGATEVSNSYGGPESGLGTAERAAYNHPGVVIAASTGDNGYDDWTAFVNEGEPFAAEQPDAPASLPTVVSVGGTTLELNGSEQRSSETVWNGNGALNESKYIEGATGGGCSTLFGAEPWQEATPGYGATGCAGKRVAADVSADANPNTGFDIYDSYNCGQVCKRNGEGKGWLMIGGTSLSTPLISSLYALAGGSNGVEYPALTLYGHLGEASSLFDVTGGGNGYCDDGGSACGANERERATVDCEGTTACNAAVGFDGPSGVGAPNSLNLFKPLLPTAAVTPPSSPESGVAASFSGATSTDPYPGAVLSYSWSWGDGTAAGTRVVPTHAYSAPGKYTVTLTVSDSYGFKSAPATTEVSVKASTLKEQEEAAAKKKAEDEASLKAQEQTANEAAQRTAAEEKTRQEAARQHEAEVNKQHEAALVKEHEEELAKSSVDAGAQGVNGFQVSFVPPVPDAELAASTLQVSPSGALTLEISCPAAETSCTGTVTLRTLGAVIAGATAPGKKASILTLTSGTFTVAGGKVHAVTLHLSSRARALLKRAHSTRARATLLAHDPLGAVHTTRTIVTLRARYASRPRS